MPCDRARLRHAASRCAALPLRTARAEAGGLQVAQSGGPGGDPIAGSDTGSRAYRAQCRALTFARPSVGGGVAEPISQTSPRARPAATPKQFRSPRGQQAASRFRLPFWFWILSGWRGRPWRPNSNVQRARSHAKRSMRATPRWTGASHGRPPSPKCCVRGAMCVQPREERGLRRAMSSAVTRVASARRSFWSIRWSQRSSTRTASAASARTGRRLRARSSSRGMRITRSDSMRCAAAPR